MKKGCRATLSGRFSESIFTETEWLRSCSRVTNPRLCILLTSLFPSTLGLGILSRTEPNRMGRFGSVSFLDSQKYLIETFILYIISGSRFGLNIITREPNKHPKKSNQCFAILFCKHGWDINRERLVPNYLSFFLLVGF